MGYRHSTPELSELWGLCMQTLVSSVFFGFETVGCGVFMRFGVVVLWLRLFEGVLALRWLGLVLFVILLQQAIFLPYPTL